MYIFRYFSKIILSVYNFSLYFMCAYSIVKIKETYMNKIQYFIVQRKFSISYYVI